MNIDDLSAMDVAYIIASLAMAARASRDFGDFEQARSITALVDRIKPQVGLTETIVETIERGAPS